MFVCLYYCLSYPACQAYAPFSIAMCGCLAVPYFFILSHKRHDFFVKRTTEHKTFVIFSTNFCLKHVVTLYFSIVMFSHCTVTKLSKLERDHKSVVCILDVTQKQDVSFSISGQKPNKDFCSPDADCIEYAIQGSVFRATRILCESSKNEPKLLQNMTVKRSSQRNGHQELSAARWN